QLVESKTAVEGFGKKLKKEGAKKYKAEIKAGKAISKKIEEQIALYIGKVDKRQGITRNPKITTVMNRIFLASNYSRSRPNGLTKTEGTLIVHAKNELKAAIKKTNAFFNTEWKEYRAKMDSITLPPFKKTETIKID
ncbi:MAG: hypothetical protein ACPG7E_06675, partial [Marinirhabdus sp.]